MSRKKQPLVFLLEWITSPKWSYRVPHFETWHTQNYSCVYKYIHTLYKIYIHVMWLSYVCACNCACILYIYRLTICLFRQMTITTGKPINWRMEVPKLPSCLCLDPTTDLSDHIAKWKCRGRVMYPQKSSSSTLTQLEMSKGSTAFFDTINYRKKNGKASPNASFLDDVPSPI